MDEIAEMTADWVQDSMTLSHPFRQTRVERSDIDGLCDELHRVKGELRDLHEYDQRLRRAIDSLSTADTKTRRVVGSRWEATLVSPSDYWSNAELKQCLSRFPDLAATYIRVSQYAPNLTEVKKLENTSGNETFEVFKRALLAARTKNNSPPSVSLAERD